MWAGYSFLVYTTAAPWSSASKSTELNPPFLRWGYQRANPSENFNIHSLPERDHEGLFSSGCGARDAQLAVKTVRQSLNTQGAAALVACACQIPDCTPTASPGWSCGS
ncbi:hypothetical protein U9M48_013427 [Paspalum notatum var. saurae]|uniref:Uncharacterized protein n=1 Tax=Paspalum notatum var. saurae TaxID=547442 RepID=A0AAQ3T0D5_PASNO